jgi:hypothetical protein
MTPDTSPMSSLGNWDDGGASVQIEEKSSWAVRFATGLAGFALNRLRRFRPAGRSSLPQEDFAAELERRLAERRALRPKRQEAARKGWQTRRAG